MKKLTAILCGFMLVISAGAAADDTSMRSGPFRPGWYVAPLLMYTKVDSSRRTDDGIGFTMAIGHRGDFASLELDAIYTSLDSNEPLDSREATLAGGALTLVAGPFFEQAFLARIIGIVGFGVFRRENHPGFGDDDSTIFGDAGLGYMHPFAVGGYDFAARVEARYRYDVQQPPHEEGAPHAFEDVAFNLGLQLPIGRAVKPVPPPKPKPVAVVPPVVVDADRDGVPDADDKCPDTPAGATVDASGCVPPPAGTAPGDADDVPGS